MNLGIGTVGRLDLVEKYHRLPCSFGVTRTRDTTTVVIYVYTVRNAAISENYFRTHVSSKRQPHRFHPSPRDRHIILLPDHSIYKSY